MDEWSQSCDGWSYDAAGNLLNDGRNGYAYDAEGRIVSLNGQPTYLYDAEGRRVAKVGSGGAVMASYVLGLGGEQVSEVNGAGAWAHSNVFVGGRLMATYEGPGGTAHLGYHFHLTDWTGSPATGLRRWGGSLGTQRMQTSVNGYEEERCYSYPFGDGLSCTGADATEHHFTGKERDAESGLDYFGARYLNCNLGRFMTPDWAAAPTGVPYASFGDPQSLNLYAYAGNNPNIWIDLDGHDNDSGRTADSAGQFTQYGTTYAGYGDGPGETQYAAQDTETTIYQHSDGSYTLTSTPKPPNNKAAPVPQTDAQAAKAAGPTAGAGAAAGAAQDAKDAAPPGNEVAAGPGADQAVADAFAAAQKYATFLLCEFNISVADVTDASPASYGALAAGATGVKQMISFLNGASKTVPVINELAALYDVAMFNVEAVKANQACTAAVYGH